MRNVFLPAMSALLILVAIWSYNWIVMKSVLSHIAPFEFAALRCASGSLILFTALFLARKRLAPPPLIPTILIGILQTGGSTGITQLALVTGGAGKTAILTYTMPFWVIILAAIFLREKTTTFQKAAFAIAGFGLVLVIRPWDGGPLLASILAVLAGLLWAAGSVMIKQIYTKAKVNLLNLTAWQLLFGTMILGLMAIIFHKEPIDWNVNVAKALMYNAFLATALASVMWLYILRTLPAGIAGMSTLLVPVTSVFLAWLKLGEKPDFYEGVGISLIVLALLLLSLPGLFHKHKNFDTKTS